MDVPPPKPANPQINPASNPAADPPANSLAGSVIGRRTERRILWLTPLLGVSASLAALSAQRRDWAVGLLIGSVLAWLNFRWLKRGLDALVVASQAQHGREKPQVPLWAYALAALRYGLLACVVYVIFEYLHVPLGSMVVGLCALGAAAIAASVWEIWKPEA